MTLSTVTVSISVFAITGQALPYARLAFELTAADINGGIVSPGPAVTATCDVNGVGNIALVPNATGSQGTQYRVNLFDQNGNLRMSALATVPDSNCNLHSILSLAAPAVVDDAQQAALDAQAAQAAAEVAQAAAAVSAAAAAYAAAATAADRVQTGLDAAAANQSAIDAEASRDAIDNRIYPGTYAEDPTTRPDGSAIQDGDMAFYADGLWRRYNGATWVASDVSTANLAAPGGSALVGHDDGTVATALDALVAQYERTPVSIGPLKVVTLGASITNGSSSSNAGVYSYSPMLGKTASNRRIQKSISYYGYPGQTSSYIASQVATALASHPDILVLGPDFGTNSAIASASDVYANFGQYVIAVAKACRAAGVSCIACLTMPQGSEQSSADTHKGIRLQNMWLSMIAVKLGIDIIDTHSPLLNNTTGYLAAANYASGADPIHPNDTGHALLASTIATWVDANLPLIPWPVGVGVAGLVANPLMIGATNNGWTLTISPSTFTGTATHTIENRVDATDLPAGRWHKTNCDASVAGGALRTGTGAFAVTPGETLLIFGYIKAEGTGTCRAVVWNTATSAIGMDIVTAVNGAASVPFCARYAVPVGATTLRLAMDLTTSIGQNLSGYLGACDIIRPSVFTNGQ